MATTPMFAPDGTLGDIPAARVQDAVNAGFKPGRDMMAPNGRMGTIPEERMQEALNAGFVLKGAAAIPRPSAPQMETSALGALAPRDVPRTKGGAPPIPGQFEGSYSTNDQDYGKYMTGLGISGAAAMTPWGRAIISKAKPFVGPAVASYAINKARQVPVLGRVIDKIPYAETLPWLFGGGGKGKAAAEESEMAPPSTDQVPGRPYKPDPRYEPPPQPEPLPQRTRPLFLRGNVDPQAQPNEPVPSNYPTPASRAASDAAFQRNFPKEDVPENWGVDLHENPTTPGPDLGDRIRAANPEPTRAEVALGTARKQASVLGETARPQTNQLDSLLKSAVGYKPPTPGEPIYKRQTATPEAPAVPEGHTPIESSALKSYKYDPTKKEFEAVTTSGSHYIYGEVPQEAADQFETADSKGKAWNDLRKTPGVVQVAQVVNGKRVATKPTSSRTADPNAPDYNNPDVLQKELTRIVQQAKGKR